MRQAESGREQAGAGSAAGAGDGAGQREADSNARHRRVAENESGVSNRGFLSEEC